MSYHRYVQRILINSSDRPPRSGCNPSPVIWPTWRHPASIGYSSTVLLDHPDQAAILPQSYDAHGDIPISRYTTVHQKRKFISNYVTQFSAHHIRYISYMHMLVAHSMFTLLNAATITAWSFPEQSSFQQCYSSLLVSSSSRLRTNRL